MKCGGRKASSSMRVENFVGKDPPRNLGSPACLKTSASPIPPSKKENEAKATTWENYGGPLKCIVKLVF